MYVDSSDKNTLFTSFKLSLAPQFHLRHSRSFIKEKLNDFISWEKRQQKIRKKK